MFVCIILLEVHLVDTPTILILSESYDSHHAQPVTRQRPLEACLDSRVNWHVTSHLNSRSHDRIYDYIHVVINPMEMGRLPDLLLTCIGSTKTTLKWQQWTLTYMYMYANMPQPTLEELVTLEQKELSLVHHLQSVLDQWSLLEWEWSLLEWEWSLFEQESLHPHCHVVDCSSKTMFQHENLSY